MNALLDVGWSLYPSVVIGMCLWTVLYVLAIRRGRPTPLVQQIAFHTGTLAGLLALISPLDELGDRYLFSAHMVQHLLLMFVTAPLWLAGSPGWLVEKIIPRRWIASVRRLTSLTPAFLVFVGVMWFWHIPSIFELAQENEPIHIIEHLTFLGAALMGWWPVFAPETPKLPRPESPALILYTFLLALPCTGLAALLTFATAPLYPFYGQVPHIFGLNALQDQHLGGLLMWLPTHMILLLALGITFWKWFRDSSRQAGPNLIPLILGVRIWKIRMFTCLHPVFGRSCWPLGWY